MFNITECHNITGKSKKRHLCELEVEICTLFGPFVENNLAKMEELNLMATFKQRQLLHPSHTGQRGGGDGDGLYALS